jgi:hypothetical protein
MRTFLLSPARADGIRMGLLRRPAARFALALELRSAEGAAIGDIYRFASALYFRGKLAYAERFGRAQVIVPGLGFVPPQHRITLGELDRLARVPVDVREPRYLSPLTRDATSLAAALAPGDEVVLLGSIATGKYTDALIRIFGERLVFPPAFVGRGDMSRGGLLLRSAKAGTELDYVPVQGAVLHGPRPPKLPTLRRGRAG